MKVGDVITWAEPGYSWERKVLYVSGFNADYPDFAYLEFEDEPGVWHKVGA